MKKATLALAGLMAVTSAANASWARWNAFGAANAFIADVQDIWTLPAVVATNANATYFEFGTATAPNTSGQVNNDPNGAWGGAHGQLGPGVLGIWVGRPYNELTNIGATPLTANLLTGATTGSAANISATVAVSSGTVSLTSVLGAPRLSNQLDILYGMSLSEQIDLGIGISRAVAGGSAEASSSAGGTTKVASTASDLGVNLGADIKNVGPIALLEIGLQYNMRSDLNSVHDAVVENKVSGSGTDMDIRIGGDIKGEGTFQRIEIGFNTDSYTLKSEYAATPAAGSLIELKNTGSAWNLGWAMGKSGDKGMGLGGFILSGSSASNDGSTTTGVGKADASNMNLVYVSAGEMKVKEWLTARAGLSGGLYGSASTSTETGPTGSTAKTASSNSNVAPTTVSAGLSLNFGDLTIDGLLNQDVLYTGTFFLSGVAESLFSQVSATWSWGGAKE